MNNSNIIVDQASMDYIFGSVGKQNISIQNNHPVKTSIVRSIEKVNI